MNRFVRFRLGRTEVQHLHKDGKRHREVDVPLRDVLIEAFGDQCHADKQQETEIKIKDAGGEEPEISAEESKIAELEKSVKKNNASLGTIKRLKADLELRQQQIAALETEVERMRTENATLSRTVTQRDSVLALNSETIKLREQDVANLETKVEEINTTARNTQADLYFQQAQALETAANRTKFAPKKKKETQREALELYKLSHSLGKQEAQAKIEELEKEVS